MIVIANSYFLNECDDEVVVNTRPSFVLRVYLFDGETEGFVFIYIYIYSRECEYVQVVGSC